MNSEPKPVIDIRVRGGITVSVPSHPRFMTTYVLLEQEDWFEKEIRFLRRFLRPGMRTIDVGANYGVYTLNMAKLVGPDGKVWAFEPAAETAAFLRRSIALNGFTNVDLTQAALSNHQGTATLAVHPNSEVNSLATTDGENTERVPVTTLDGHHVANSAPSLDFIKIDAEGEELNIVDGAQSLLSNHSPLVMFEIRQGESINRDLIKRFPDLGYALFRLAGPDRLLVPVAADATLDSFEINLFACKPDRAVRLAQDGLLALEVAENGTWTAGIGVNLIGRQPFGALCPRPSTSEDGEYYRCLDAYAIWRDETESQRDRAGALLAAASLARTLAPRHSDIARLSTIARIASEAGERATAVDVLGRVLTGHASSEPRIEAPFWPASERFDTVNPAGLSEVWAMAAVADAFERLRAFSSYFAPVDTYRHLAWLKSTPFHSAEMERRLQFQRLRAGRQKGYAASPLLACHSPDNLNQDIWDRLVTR